MSSKLYLYPDTHTYKDDRGRQYISVTTLLGKYAPSFEDKKWDIAKACEKIGKNPRHKKYIKYKGMTAEQLVAQWKEKSEVAAEKGNRRHAYYEDSINSANGFTKFVPSKLPNDHRIYTLDEIMDAPYGELNLTLLPESLKVQYPRIYNTLQVLMEHGYWIFPEVCVHIELPFMISGLIDVFAVRKDSRGFVIVDWKTNKDPIRFEPGYWDHDRDGNRVGWVDNEDRFRYPISRLPFSIGNKFAMQVSLYAYLAEAQGFTPQGLTIFNTPDEVYAHDEYEEENLIFPGKPKVHVHPVPYYKKEVLAVLADYVNRRRVA